MSDNAPSGVEPIGPTPFTAAINFRADPALLEALRNQAMRSGASVSQVIREALRENLEPGGEAVAAFNPFAHLQAAAAGDLEAQRRLAEAGQTCIAEGDLIGAVESLIFARLAAAQGDQGDVGRLLAMMALVGDMIADSPELSDYADMLNGESVAIVSRLADQGVELAEQILPALSEGSSPRAMHNAKQLSKMMGAQ